MNLLKKLFNFYINSSIHVSISVFCLTKITLLGYGITENFAPFYVFLSTIISYNFIKYYALVKENNSFRKGKRKIQILLVIHLICLLGLAYLSFFLNWESILVLVPVLMITIFYITPLSFTKNNLREVATLKIFLIGFSWAITTVWFPLVQYHIEINTEVWALFLQRILFVIAITLPFDLRDIHTDHPELKTIPQVFGVQKTKYLGTILLVVFVLLTSFTGALGNQEFLTTIIIAVISLLFLLFSKESQSKYYSSFWVESVPIFWWLLFLVY